MLRRLQIKCTTYYPYIGNSQQNTSIGPSWPPNSLGLMRLVQLITRREGTSQPRQAQVLHLEANSPKLELNIS
jgi:hypothetical protein